ncbi:YceI family protein [Erythrobacter cryptus]|uniref:YceI family protein n=1 Tax=Erythrobacter cryptus TaxID=196588 RepID=UPI00056BC0C8|nr:YceI family protein [Erythrobacter cryptus]
MISKCDPLRRVLLALAALLALANSAPGAPLRYSLDASASTVAARVPFFGLASKTARFPKMEGVVTIVPGAPERAVIDVSFDAAAIEAPDPITLARLKGEKFFWVEKYPKIRFVGRALRLTSPTSGTLQGELTARGITRPQVLAVRFDADPAAQAGRPVSFTGTTTIDRRDYGMKAYQLLVGNKVEITLKARMVPRER